MGTDSDAYNSIATKSTYHCVLANRLLDVWLLGMGSAMPDITGHTTKRVDAAVSDDQVLALLSLLPTFTSVHYAYVQH